MYVEGSYDINNCTETNVFRRLNLATLFRYTHTPQRFPKTPTKMG